MQSVPTATRRLEADRARQHRPITQDGACIGEFFFLLLCLTAKLIVKRGEDRLFCPKGGQSLEACLNPVSGGTRASEDPFLIGRELISQGCDWPNENLVSIPVSPLDRLI